MAWPSLDRAVLGGRPQASDFNALRTRSLETLAGMATRAGQIEYSTGANETAVLNPPTVQGVLDWNPSGNGAMTWRQVLAAIPSSLTATADDDKVVTFGVLRQHSFLQNESQFRLFQTAGNFSFTWPWNTDEGYIVAVSGRGGYGGHGGGGGGGNTVKIRTRSSQATVPARHAHPAVSNNVYSRQHGGFPVQIPLAEGVDDPSVDTVVQTYYAVINHSGAAGEAGAEGGRGGQTIVRVNGTTAVNTSFGAGGAGGYGGGGGETGGLNSTPWDGGSRPTRRGGVLFYYVWNGQIPAFKGGQKTAGSGPALGGRGGAGETAAVTNGRPFVDNDWERFFTVTSGQAGERGGDAIRGSVQVRLHRLTNVPVDATISGTVGAAGTGGRGGRGGRGYQNGTAGTNGINGNAGWALIVPTYPTS